jgi:hypothetical protein
MPTHRGDPIIPRISRAQASIAATERHLAAARERRGFRDVARLERELANLRAYLVDLVAVLRGPATE